MARSPNTQTATVSAVATSTTSVVIVPATAAGAARIIVNDSAVVLFLRLGAAAASSTDYSLSLAAGERWTAPDSAYGGTITGILASGTGTARVTSY